MRKLLLGTTALAAAATISANAALADVSISGSYEFKYLSRSSNDTNVDGTSFAHGDNDLIINFTSKTDSGLDLTYRYDFGAVASDGAGHTADENSLTIAGGFGKLVLGTDDDASDAYGIAEMDLIAEEPTASTTDSSIRRNSDLGSTDAMKVAYHLPAIGGLTVGASFADSGAVGASDATAYGANYAMDAGGASITLGYATKTTENATQDQDDTNMGVKVVSGDISLIISQGHYEANDEDIESQGGAISYKMPNGMTVGAFTFKSEDDQDVGEEYTASGAEVQYSIASGLTAVITVVDYDYKVTATNHENTPVADSGTMSQLTLKTSF
jgi:outer membrane protein OmpU